MRRALRFLVCLAALSATLSGQERRQGTVAPFHFTASPSSIRSSKATSTELTAAEASVRKLASLITEVPALNPPLGFDAALVGVLEERDPTQARQRPVAPLDIWLRFGAPRSRGDEVLFLHFYINDLRPVILDHLGLRKWEDDRGDIYLEPARTGEVGGFPMYNDLLVVARPGDSIWAPVTVERFAAALGAQVKAGAEDAEKRRSKAKAELDAFLSVPEEQKRRTELEAARQRSDGASEVRRLQTVFAEDEAAIRRRLDPDPSKPADVAWYFGPVNAYRDLQALVAGLDAAGRRAAACVTGGDAPERWRTRIVPPETPGCRRVVEANLGLFKPQLPRSAIQLITVEDIEYCRRDLASRKERTVGDCAANLDVARQLDWKRVAALLEQ
jgi:hypothetical protein